MTNSRFTFPEGSLLNFSYSRTFGRYVAMLVLIMSLFLSQASAAISVSSTPQTNNDFCGSGAPSLTLPIVATSGCGSATIGYKWYVGSVLPANQITASGSPNYSGWTTSTLIVGSAANLGTNTAFYAVLSETSGACSDIDTVGPYNYTKVASIPTLTFNTNPFNVCQNSLATYTVNVTAPSPAGNLTYNWYRKAHGGAFVNTQNISKTSTTDSYAYNANFDRDNDSVYVTASNSCGASTSARVGLRVNSTPRVTVAPSMSTLTACEGAGFNVSYSIDTANYHNRGTNINWSLTASGGSSASLLALLTTSGTGATNVNLVGIGAGLTPGFYSVTFTTATNTTDGCPRSISTNSIGVTIYPKPIVNFIATPSDYCRETGATSYQMQVSNAQYNNGSGLVNVAWTVNLSEASRNITGGCGLVTSGVMSTTITGTGNQTITINPSTNLSPGTYSYTLTSVSNTSNSCAGTIGATPTVTWNVRPRPSVQVVPTSTETCEGVSKQFSVIVTNAAYCVGAAPTNASWSLTHTDGTNSNIPATPLTGSGNGTSGPYTTDATKTAGTYTFTPGTITNTTAGHGSCARVITGNTFTLTVNPTPSVTFSTANIKQCEGTAGTTFTMTISNAMLNAVGQNWSVSYTDAGGNALSGTPCSAGSTAGIITGGQSGTGNTVKTFTIPSTLAPGYYTYTLTKVTNTSSGCETIPSSASVGAIGTITIIIDPAPILTLNPDFKDVCESDMESFLLSVTNTKGCSGIGSSYNADWTFDGLADGTQSNVTGLGGYPNGNGNLVNQTITVNTPATLPPQNRQLRLGVLNTTAATACAAPTNVRKDTFDLKVSPRPDIKINNSAAAVVTVDICEGTASSFNFTVTNAEQNGSAIPWEVTYSESSGNLVTSCNNTAGANKNMITGTGGIKSGTGNGTTVFTIPGTLEVGRYTYTVSNIVNTDGPCTGYVNGVISGTQTIVINVHPKPIVNFTSTTAQVCQNTVATNAIGFVVTNAEYCSAANTKTGIGYSLAFTDGVQKSGAGTPLTGTGNGTQTFHANNSTTLAVGTHTLTTGNMSLTGVPVACTYNTNKTFTLTVNPRPVATFSRPTIDICEGSSDTLSIKVLNAMLNASPVNWTITTSQSSGNIPNNCVNGAASNATITGLTTSFNGSGNKAVGVMAFTIPNTLAPGRYTYTITGISNTSGLPNCTGSVAPTSTVVINVYPKPVVNFTPTTAQVCQNTVATNAINFVVTNAEYCSAPNTKTGIGYSLAFTDGVQKSGAGTPLTGTGNGTQTFHANNSTTLAVGTHTLTTGNMSLTGVPVACTYNTNKTFTLTVNPRPVATFSRPTIDICEGSSDTLSIKVLNAMLNASPVNWTITTSQSSGNIPNNCVNGAASNATITGLTTSFNGSGNKAVGVMEFTIPNTLAPGRYTYTITGITNTSGSPNCGGSIAPTSTVVINVYPKPIVSFSPTSGQTCQGATAFNAINFVVTNAEYCSAPNTKTNIGYSLAFTDGVQKSGAGTPLTGSGNGTQTFDANSSGTLAVGTHTLVTGNMSVTGVPVSCTYNTNKTYSLTVNPRPIVTFSSTPINVCEGTPGTFNVEVTNAMLNGNPVNWTFTATEASGNLPNNCSQGAASNKGLVVTRSGAGNKTGGSVLVYTIPATWEPGVYTYTITSMNNDDASCAGTINPIGTITINVFPKIGIAVTPAAGSVCEGDNTTFNITATNAKYCTALNVAATNMGWNLAYTSNLNDNLGGSPYFSSGNSSTTVIANNGGFLPANGTYVFTANSVSPATGPACVQTLTTNNKFALTVNAEPVATFSASNVNVCQGSTGTFDLIVSNAVTGTTNVPWAINVTGDSTTVANSCAALAGGPAVSGIMRTSHASADITGSGNTTRTFNIPATLAPGVYRFTLAGITNTTPPCTGLIGGIPTITIVVYPMPDADLSEDSLTVCENTTASFDMTVTNAQYCASIGGGLINVGWEMSFVDAADSDVPSHIWTSSGNMAATTYSVNVTNALTTGIGSLDISQLRNTTHNCINTDSFGGTELVVKINDLPTLAITNVTVDTCLNNPAQFRYYVTDVPVGQTWEFTYTDANATTQTVSGVSTGAVNTGLRLTTAYSTVGTKTTTFTKVKNLTTGCLANAPHGNISTNVLALPNVTTFAPTTSAIICSGLTNSYTLNIINSAGKNWAVTYNINGGPNLTWTGIGNGPSVQTIPAQYWFSASGAQSTRSITITKIVWTGTVPACENTSVTSPTSSVVVNSRPAIDLVSPTNTCVNYTADIAYTVTGIANAQNWGFNWYTTGPTNGPNALSGSGAANTGIFTTQPLTPVGTSKVYVNTVTNTSTGCDSSNATWFDNITVDPPTVPGTLSPNYTICDGDVGPFTFTLTGYTGTIQNWDSSENLAYSWINIGQAGKATHTVTSPHLTTNYQVVVKSGACPADSSNDVILFVHPQPAATIVSLTDSICTGSNINMVYNVTGVPNTHSYTINYTVKIGAGAPSAASLTGTGSAANKTLTLTNGGGGFSSGPVVVTFTSITNTNTNCDSTLTSTKTTKVKTAPVGASATTNQTLCQNSSGFVRWTGTAADGYVVGWESKVGSGAWSSISGSASDTLMFTGLTTTTLYRAVVENYPCTGQAYSSPATITIIATNPTANFYNLPSSNKHCASATGTTTLQYEVSGTNGNGWTLTIREGDSLHTVTGTGDKVGGSALTFTTSPGKMQATFNVTLIKLEITSGTTTCTKNLDNTAMAVVSIIDLPSASINSVSSPVCSGTSITVSFNVSNIKQTENWSIAYTVNGSSQTLTGQGPSNPTAMHTVTGNNVTQTIVLNSITNTTTKNSAGNSCTNTITGVSKTYVVKGATSPGTIGTSASVCKGASGTVSQTAASSNGSVLTGWVSSTWNGTGWSSWASTGNTSNSQSYINLTSSTRYRAIYTNNPCDTAGSNTVVITVLELPIATISLTTGNDTICEGATSTITVNTSNMTAGQTFTLNYVEGSVSKSKNLTNTAPITFTTGVITSTTDITLTSVSTTSGVTCSNTALNSTVTVTVQEKPTGTIASFDNLICHGSTVNYTLTIGNVGTTDKWTATVQLNAAATQTLTGVGTGTFAGTTTATATITPTSVFWLRSVVNNSTQDACVSTINQSKNITVKPKTVAGTISANASVCKGSSGTLSATGGTGPIDSWMMRTHNGTSYGSWSSIGNTASTQSYTNLQNTTQYRAIYKNTPCDTAGSNTITITVLELPTATLSLTTGNDTICEGATTTVTVTVANIVSGQGFRIDYTEGSSTKFKTFTHNGSATYTFTTGTITTNTVIALDKIQTTSGVTCTNTSLNSSVTVTVQENPTVTIASYDNLLCHGEDVDFAVTVGNVGSANNWTLNYTLDGTAETRTGTGVGTFNFTTTKTVTATTDVLALVKITNNKTQDACFKNYTTSVNITVDTTTVPGVIGTSKISGDTTICKGASAQVVQFKAGKGNITKWQSRVKSSSTWVDIASTATSINVYNISDTTFYRAIYQNGVCLTSMSNVVAVNPKKLPLAIITNVVDDSICAGTTADFEVTLSNVAAGQTFKLNYKVGSVSKTASLTQNGSGVHTLNTGTLTSTSQIQLTSVSVTSGHPQCSDTLNSNGTVTVLSLPFATITAGPDTICQADKIVFTVNISNVSSTDNWRLVYELENDKDTITGQGPGSFTRVDTDANTAESAKIQLIEILNLANLGVCKSVNTDDWDVYIYKPTEPGTIQANDTICKGSSTTIKEIVGTPKQGVTVSWEYKPNSASNWTALSNSNSTLNVINLQETTSYRAIYKSGVCDTAHSNVIKIEVRELPLATISGSTTICAGDSTDLDVVVTNVGSTQAWEIEYLVGTQIAYMYGTGSGTHTLKVGNFITTSDVTLREISTLSGIPMCTNNKLTNNAKATININARPFASLNSTNSPVCQNSTSTFNVSISNVKSGDKWTLTYNVNDAVFSTTKTGTGPGTVTITTPSLVTAKTYFVELVKIVNNTTGCDSNLTSKMGIVVDATTQAGSVASDTTVCYADHIGTVKHTGGNGSIIRWEVSQDNGTSWATITNTASSYTYNNLTSTSKFRAIKRNGNICAEAATAPITVTVNKLPVATISGSDTICAATAGTLVVTATNTQGEDWRVSYLVGTRLDTITVSGPLTSATINTGSLNKTTDVTLKKIWMISGTPKCQNDNLTNNAKGTVEVDDLPSATLISLTDSVCTGTPAYGKATIAGMRSFEKWKLYWSINGGSADSTTGTGPGSFNFTTKNLTVNTSTVRFTKIRNTSTGCQYLPTDEEVVIVSPVTVGGTLAGTATVCKGANSGTLTLGADSRGTVLGWEYSTDNGTTWTAISNKASTYSYSNLTVSTIYRVSVKNGACNQAYSSTVKITVNELPVATIVKVGAANICDGSGTFVVVNVTNVGSGMTWDLKYLQGSSVKTLSGTGSTNDTIFTGALTSTTDITLQTLKMTSGAPICENLNLNNNHTTTITVIDNPTATITNYTSPICKGATPTITVMVGNVKTGQAWTIVYKVANGTNRTSTGVGAGQFDLNNVPAFNTEGMIGVRLVTITNTSSTPNCTGQLKDSVTIKVDSTSLGGTITGISKVCKGSNGALKLGGRRGDVTKWQYSTDGINYYDVANTSDSLIFTNLTTKTWYRAVVMNGVCASALSSVKIVDIQELPTLSITNPTQTICAGNSTTVGVTIGNVSGTDTWTVNYKENGTSGSASGTGTSRTFTFGPYTTTTTIEFTKITLTSGLGCTNNLSEKAVITVTPNPTATITSVPDSLCKDDVLSFTVSVDNVASGVAWNLDYDVDGVGAPTKKGNGSGTFTVNTTRKVSPNNTVIELKNIALNTALGCFSVLTDTRTIKVSPTTVGGTLSPATATVCKGAGSTLTLTGETGAVKNWEYSTDGGATWTVTSNTAKTLNATNLSETTMYRVFVKSGSCNGAYSSTATIAVIPTPDATVTSNAKVCPGDVATFTLHVKDVAAADGWSVVYKRNGTTAGTPVTGTGSGDFNFTVAGSAYAGNPTLITVELVSITNTTHGCPNATLKSTATARVTPNPIANFTASNDCKDSVIAFNNTSTIPEGNITTYKWYFGDGDSSVNGSTTHAYKAAGTYNVRLVVWSDNGCRGEVTKTITVYPNPIAKFTMANVCKNQTFSATDASTVSSGSIVAWLWNFGDNSTSTAQNPTHVYAASGNYNVTLTVTTNNGCTNTLTKPLIVYILPEANFVADPVCENTPMSFINSSAIGYGTMTYDWNFAGQGTATAKDPNFTFTGFGPFNVRLIAISNNGCRDTVNRTVTVHPAPTANFTVAPACIGDVSTFVNNSSVASGTIAEYYWDFGDATFSGLKNPTHQYAAAGTYTVNLRVKSALGCESSFTANADVLALPDVKLVAQGPTSFCDGKNVVLTAGDASTRTWAWTFTGGTGDKDTLRAFTTGWYKVRITSAPIGCANEDSIFVNVWALPDAKAWLRSDKSNTLDSIQKGASIDLHASGGVNYTWSPVTYLMPTIGPDVMAERMELTTKYTVTVTDLNGCVNTASVEVVVLDDFQLIVYNAVTPNNDGMNDTWIIENIWAYPTAEVIIFNRYGMEVYRGDNYKNDWDAKFNGNELPDGPYYYVVIHPDFPDTVYKGVLNVIRERK